MVSIASNLINQPYGGSRNKLFSNQILIFQPYPEHRPHGHREVPLLPRTESTSEFQPLEDKEVEYFFASDASAVIEHTNRVIYLEVCFLNFLSGRLIINLCIDFRTMMSQLSRMVH